MPKLPATEERIQQHTPEDINKKIQNKIQQNIDYYKGRDRREIQERIEELNKEWDTERVLEANASTLVVIGSVLGFFVNKKWNLLPGIVGAFLFQHAIQGWCPPLTVIRQLEVRTASEIIEEKNALEQLIAR